MATKMTPYEFRPLTLTTGPLATMEFTPIGPAINRTRDVVEVKYQGPGDGPISNVLHTRNRGEFDRLQLAEDVRLAFSKLLPLEISWNGGTQTYHTEKGQVVWDRNIARFVACMRAKRPARKATPKKKVAQKRK